MWGVLLYDLLGQWVISRFQFSWVIVDPSFDMMTSSCHVIEPGVPTLSQPGSAFGQLDPEPCAHWATADQEPVD